MNKRAQDLSIGTLVLIVLGIIVLVLLILGFSMGWSNLWEKINIFQGGSSLDEKATTCGVAANSNGATRFCEFSQVKVSGKTEFLNCLDTRVDAQLDKRLECKNATGSVLTGAQSAIEYCISRNATSKITTPVMINGKAYNETCA